VADAEQVNDAAEAYVYGYPLVYDLKEVAGFVEGGGSLPIQAPYNRFAYARQLLGPETKFVSPNNDTLYIIAHCDVCQDPLVLHVPDAADRYYVLQFIDAWTNNFAYIGRRATGTAEAEYLLTDDGYEGEVPDGMTVVSAPTGVFTIGGRVQVDGQADLAAVHALQDQFTLTPLSVDQGGAAPPPVAGVPKPDPRVRDDLEWWERFRVALAAFPPTGGGRTVPGPGRAVRGHRRRVTVCRSRPRAGRGPGRRAAGGPGQDRGAGQGQRQCAGRLDQCPAPVRLQPGPPRPGHHRRARVEDPRPNQGLRDPGGGGPGRAVGQPRV
jgi:hypothetical protein